MTATPALQTGDRVLVGTRLITVDETFASSLQEGDSVLGVAASGQLRRIPSAVQALVNSAVGILFNTAPTEHAILRL